ncbi:MAG TPA: Ref family recombination enhancement nuclease [Comamonas sp.]
MKAWNSTFKAPAKPMQRSKPMKFKQNRKAGLASRGMKGRSVTAEQKAFHDLLASIGCVACRLDRRPIGPVSIHHIDGRTKPDAHWLVLPLCAGHHQDGTGVPGLVSVHPWKPRFESIYGPQRDLLRLCVQTLLDRGASVPDGALRAANLILETA